MRIKKVTQTTPIQAEVIDSLDGDSTTNAPSVRAVNEGLLEKYSTEEKVIGTWIDEKPLYRKTVGFTTGSSSNAWTTISGLANIKDIPYYSGYIYTSDTETFLIPSSNPNNCPYFSVNKSSYIVREAHTNDNCNSKTCVITFIYTKTTD